MAVGQCSLIEQSTAYHMVSWIFRTNDQRVSKLQQGLSMASCIHQSLSIEIPTNKQPIKQHSNMILMDSLGMVS
jgi:hypothetical protein